MLELGIGGGIVLGPVPRSTELGEGENGILVTGPVNDPDPRLLAEILVGGTAVELLGLGYGASGGIAGGIKDGEGEATHSRPRGPTTSEEEREVMVVGVDRVHNEESVTELG